DKGNLILRGAGPTQTVLLFPKSLEDLFGNRARGTQQSQWAFRPGLINVTGKDPINAETRLASVTADARRGSRTLQIQSTPTNGRIKKGEWVRLVESDP